MTSTTQLSLLLNKKFGDHKVSSTAVPTPGKGEVLVKILASALNPADWKIKKYGFVVETFPAVLGTDIAGEVVGLGDGVSSVALGDRVFFQGVYGDTRYAGFQQYTLADVHSLSKIPDNLTYDEASTLPLTLTTAWVGLHGPAPLGFSLDSPATTANAYTGTPLLVIGGSSGVGQAVIQLARLSGFNPIIATASAKHANYLKSLGATHVLDRSAPLDLASITALLGTTSPIPFVYDAISTPETITSGFSVLPPGGKLAIVSPATDDLRDQAAKEGKGLIGVWAAKQLPSLQSTIKELWSNVAEWVRSGKIKANNVEVLPNGLNGIEVGLKRLEEGQLSASKLVTRPWETAALQV